MNIQSESTTEKINDVIKLIDSNEKVKDKETVRNMKKLKKLNEEFDIKEIKKIISENPESIDRLKEYKELIQMFIDKIDSYALTNKIKLDIENDKKHRRGLSFGSGIDKINQSFSIINMFKNNNYFSITTE